MQVSSRSVEPCCNWLCSLYLLTYCSPPSFCLTGHNLQYRKGGHYTSLGPRHLSLPVNHDIVTENSANNYSKIQANFRAEFTTAKMKNKHIKIKTKVQVMVKLVENCCTRFTYLFTYLLFTQSAQYSPFQKNC